MRPEPQWGAKVFYKIGEVSTMTKLPAYVLRFWESEFSFLKPKKSRGNQRLYIQRDIETVLEIRRMLYDEGHTLEGVKRFWARRGRHHQAKQSPREIATRLRSDLQAILRLLDMHGASDRRERVGG
ncbi:MAG: MerR family transcriptional regulator [Nitrospiraceae bacterium]